MLARVQEREGISLNWAEMGLRYAESVGGEENGWQFLERNVGQYPRSVAPRLLLARRLLNACHYADAMPHLHQLDAQGVAEATYFLGVAAIRSGDLARALTHMERALALSPDHAQTQDQVRYLRGALGIPAEANLKPNATAKGEEKP